MKPPYSKTLVITRPEADACALAATLTAKGFHCLIDPMLAIEPVIKNKKSLKAALEHKPQAILASSRHALSVFAELTKLRDIPVIAVGKVTATHATNLGFKLLGTAGGTARSLVTHTKKLCKPDGGRLLYICGAKISVDIASILARQHFRIDTVILYRAIAAQRFSADLRNAFLRETIGGVLFFSQRTAATYVKLALRHNLKDAHRLIRAFSTSEGIAGTLRKLPWKEIIIATNPDTECMLDKVNSLRR